MAAAPRDEGRRRLEPYVTRARIFARRVRAFLGKGWITPRTRIVVEAAESDCAQPILIAGTHRSGSSLLRRILDSHPHVACPPESFFLVHFAAMVQDPATFCGLAGMGFDEPTARELIRHRATSFHELYRRARGKPRWADKTPRYALRLPQLDELLCRRCVYLCIVRHPLDVAYSIWSRGWRLPDMRSEADEPDLLRAVCYYVARSTAAQLDFRAAHGERCHTVRYEELVTGPEPVLRRMCRFLEEPWDARLLEHGAQPHDPGLEDPIVGGSPGFRPSIGNWRAWHPDQQAQARALLAPTMATLGYP